MMLTCLRTFPKVARPSRSGRVACLRAGTYRQGRLCIKYHKQDAFVTLCRQFQKIWNVPTSTLTLTFRFSIHIISR
ncbi:hypothetical protein KsCSTR_27890 [Candidatus Kuenenia stuttgartiensis]|uniref:Uncharacterized protein n=1 Tax=Kuenenia stuttgartiensis TaxID=174633 RepID=Q1Q0Q5_KUEST|nr:hypothetical protein KsCSTR_27890 [Candidatus Kuenenia stuttgartiensis]CAJ73584.1 unknown protein [Candidatus Kuenenia stuttgartiensis]